MGTKRDDFSQDTIRRAAMRVGYRCSCPECRVPTVGPSEENDLKYSSIGEASHICAAAPRGPRYDPNMTSEERRSISNCIWLCKKCARLIDTDVKKYTVELLREWKESAEENASLELGIKGITNLFYGGKALTDIPIAVDLIGRKEDIEKIKEKMIEHNIVCIIAEGGVGKSAVAAAICNDYKSIISSNNIQFKYVAWINSTCELKKDLCSLDVIEGLSNISEKDKFSIIYRWLKEPENSTLLIIDNMDKEPTVEERRLLNTISGCTKIIITSRTKFRDFYKYNLSEIDDYSAVCLLYRHFLDCDMSFDLLQGRDDFLVANNIIKGITNNNALLIELIGKMAYSENVELAEIWKRLKENVIDIDSEMSLQTAHAESHGLDPERETNLTMQEQIRRLYQMSGLSDEQVTIMSFFAVLPVGTKVFYKMLDWCEFKKVDIQWLLKRGWIKRDEESYYIHPIVRQSVNLQNKKSGYVFCVEDYHNLLVELINVEQYLPNDLEYSKYKERAEIIKVLCNLIENEGYIGELPFRVCFCVSSLYYREGNYIDSIRYKFKSLDIIRMFFGGDNLTSATVYESIAMTYFELYQFEEALEYLEKGMEIKLKYYKDDDLEMASSYNDIAEIYDKLKQYEKSEYNFKTALSTYIKHGKENNLCTINAYDNLANMYNDWGRYEDSLAYHKKAIDYYERVLGENHPETATAYNNIGLTYHNLGDNINARIYLEKSVAIRNRLLNKKHPHLGTTLCILLDVYTELGDMDAYKKTKTILEDEFGLVFDENE